MMSTTGDENAVEINTSNVHLILLRGLESFTGFLGPVSAVLVGDVIMRVYADSGYSDRCRYRGRI